MSTWPGDILTKPSTLSGTGVAMIDLMMLGRGVRDSGPLLDIVRDTWKAAKGIDGLFTIQQKNEFVRWWNGYASEPTRPQGQGDTP